VLLVAAPAGAAPTPATGPTSAPTQPGKKSSFSIALGGTYKTHGRSYVLPRSRVQVKGTTNADLAGETVTIVITKKGRVAKTDRVKLVSHGGKATFSTAFSAGKRGKYVVKLDLTPEQADVATASGGKGLTIVKTGIHSGSHGISVKVYQNKLGSLGYVVPHNGKFDSATGRAFMAFRKVTGMSRTFSAGKAVASKLAKGKGAFHLRYPKAGRHVEVSIKKQVMVFSDNGKVQRIYHVSTGKPSTPTVRGTFHVYMKDPGTNAKGMVKSNYFTGGYAIHGYAEVPPYNASHGCVRVPVPNAASIYGWVNIGTRVDVYY
jgi:hypothetical protein